ncbi:MAG: carboxypeptidase regulatory-like domain-containing protein, partial [Acidobacteria bacterium]|nr:carboxypeptidase regulatory-like domain-containing protein [Acidobacteriota bacterium]
MTRAIVVIMCLVFSQLSLLAQAEAGVATLSGVVLDASGATVPGAKVRVQSQEMGTQRMLESSDAGLFTAVRLPAGRYEVTIEKNGFKTLRREGLVLQVGAVLSYDVVLEVGSSAETVNVNAETPLVESTRSQTSTNVDQRLVRDLPINGRNFLDFTILTPGVVKDPRTGDLAFAGQRGPSNSLLVDGMDANCNFWGQSVGRAGFRNPYSFSQDSVQEFQVNTNAYAAEFGRATGGVVNVLTKSGTNQFHGTGFWFFRDRAMNANTFFNNRAGIVRQPYHFNQFGGNLGGPVVKNKLFFFYNYDGQRNNSPIAPFFPIAIPGDALSQQAGRELSQYLTPYSIGQNNNIHTAKIDWNATAQHTFSFRYNAHRFTGVNYESPGSQSSVDHTGDTILNTDNVTATHTWVLGGNKVIDQRFVYLDERNPSTTNGKGAEIVVRQSGVTMMVFGNANFLPRFVNQKKYGAVQSFNWNLGSHSLKFGHDFKFERAQQLNSNLFFGQYTFDSLADFTNRRPSSFAQAFPGAGTSGGNTFPNADEYAFYAQ